MTDELNTTQPENEDEVEGHGFRLNAEGRFQGKPEGRMVARTENDDEDDVEGHRWDVTTAGRQTGNLGRVVARSENDDEDDVEGHAFRSRVVANPGSENKIEDTEDRYTI